MKLEKLQSKKQIKKELIYKTVVIPILIAFVLGIAAQWFLRSFYAFPVRIDSISMEPTLKKNERIFVRYPYLKNLEKNDIVLVKTKYSNTFSLCRVVAMEGDQISVSRGRVIVNGNPINPYNHSALKNNNSNKKKKTIRPDFFFCLNDNPEITTDSRMWGAFKLSQIHGVHTSAFYLF